MHAAILAIRRHHRPFSACIRSRKRSSLLQSCARDIAYPALPARINRKTEVPRCSSKREKKRRVEFLRIGVMTTRSALSGISRTSSNTHRVSGQDLSDSFLIQEAFYCKAKQRTSIRDRQERSASHAFRDRTDQNERGFRRSTGSYVAKKCVQKIRRLTRKKIQSTLLQLLGVSWSFDPCATRPPAEA